MARKSDEKIKYLVSDKQGEFIIELPATWKVTFAAVNPSNGQSYRDGFCLRVWEGQKLRAVFNNVQRFRDLSIPLARKVSRETGSSSWTQDSQGNFEEARTVNVEHRIEPGDDFDDPFVTDLGGDD